jgi:hypothetical protein
VHRCTTIARIVKERRIVRSRVPSVLVILAGVVFFVAGVATYALVSTTLAAQKITVSEDANYFAG